MCRATFLSYMDWLKLGVPELDTSPRAVVFRKDAQELRVTGCNLSEAYAPMGVHVHGKMVMFLGGGDQAVVSCTPTLFELHALQLVVKAAHLSQLDDDPCAEVTVVGKEDLTRDSLRFAEALLRVIDDSAGSCTKTARAADASFEDLKAHMDPDMHFCMAAEDQRAALGELGDFFRDRRLSAKDVQQWVLLLSTRPLPLVPEAAPTYGRKTGSVELENSLRVMNQALLSLEVTAPVLRRLVETVACGHAKTKK